jgi:N-methylhydantoinase A
MDCSGALIDSTRMPTAVAVDIGGTFTDLVAIDTETGDAVTVKEPSVPSNFVDGVAAALERAGAGAIQQFRHGTTVGTNAIIERRGAHTGLLTTFGFRDVLLAGRANKPDLYDSDWDPPPALVPRERIKGIRERVDYAGRVVTELVEEDVRAATRELMADGVQAIAICFLNSFVNGAHEHRARELVAAEAPDVFVCTSSEVLPEIREFERTSTAVANAYLGPNMSSYLDRLERTVREGGVEGARLDGELLVSHSGGGLMTVASACRLPARICQSGPAAGVMGARAVARRLGDSDSISLDMGGTSADIAAIIDGEPVFRNEWHIEFNIPILFPAIDLVTIGAGGGTIAWIDDAGTLRSGPQSAGAMPGPVCYQRGGTEPTNTDANLALGRIRAENFLGGRMALDRDAAERAIADRIAEPLGMSPDDAAVGMLRLSNTAMLNAIRLMTTQRGFDPRAFSLIAFGGAGALHAADLAREIGIGRVVVPHLPGLMSARGILYVDVRHDLLEPVFQRASTLDPERIRAATERSLEACDVLKSRDSSIEEWTTQVSVDLRYFGQISGYLTKSVPDGDVVEGIRTLIEQFDDEHEREFGYRLPEELTEVEIVNLRTTLVGRVDDPPEPKYEPSGERGEEASGSVYFLGEGARIDAPYVERESLAVGERLEGPMVITEWDSTTVVPPRSTVTVQETGDLVMALDN